MQDDSSFVQGPFSSLTMLEWQRAGYFRSGLLLRREVRVDFFIFKYQFILSQVDNIFSNLATYTALYGRSPFSPGTYPLAIIVRTTPLTTTTTTTTSTTTTTTTKATTTSPPRVSSDRFYWAQADNDHVLPARGVGIIPEYDYEEDGTQEAEREDNHQELEAVAQPSPTEITEGSLRLVGGHDVSEVMKSIKKKTLVLLSTESIAG